MFLQRHIYGKHKQIFIFETVMHRVLMSASSFSQGLFKWAKIVSLVLHKLNWEIKKILSDT